MTGKDMIFSTVKSQSRYSFGKAHDRFSVPTRKVPAPAPGAYTPLDGLNQNFNSTFQKAQQTKIGLDKSSVIDKHFGLDRRSPGPGAYTTFSDFSGQH